MTLRTASRATRPAVGTLGATLLAATTILALLAVTAPGPEAAAASGRRPRPTATVTATQAPTPSPSPTPTLVPTPTPTPTPTPAATPTPAPSTPTSTGPSPSGCATVTWQGTAYCPVFIRELLDGLRPAGSAVVVQQATVVGTAGATVTMTGATWCPPGTWCGQLLDVLAVAFPAGATLPAYGDVVDVYGRVIAGGIAPDGFAVLGRCDPDLGC